MINSNSSRTSGNTNPRVTGSSARFLPDTVRCPTVAKEAEKIALDELRGQCLNRFHAGWKTNSGEGDSNCVTAKKTSVWVAPRDGLATPPEGDVINPGPEFPSVHPPDGEFLLIDRSRQPFK